ncbi:putative lipid II flippase FtsW [Candidatus Berkelbacteria bacterium]|nr:putative lipid II flippase FtsW [Candidatus Berkelbacteria bacterium]
MATILGRYRQAFYPRIDYWLLFVVTALTLFGLLMISSSSVVISFERFGTNWYYLSRQAIAVVLGMVALAISVNIDYRFWRRIASPFMAISVILLILVFVPGIGLKLSGASRWINLGPVLLQPSEIVKLSFVIYLATWLERRGEAIKHVESGLFPFSLLLIVLIGLIVKQPDLGTVIVISLIAASMFWAAGARTIHLLGAGVSALALFFVLIRFSSYRWQRFLTFLNPSTDLLGSGYQFNQTILAIGSGGLFGLGFGNSRQKYLYLPQAHTDAIFAVIVEELGFLRTIPLLAALVFVALRGLRIARKAPDDFGKLLAVGIASWVAGQSFVNIAANLGIVPLTGVPLPFVSYGGSALVMLLIAIGILLNISKRTIQN